jgi:hypothetical protein
MPSVNTARHPGKGPKIMDVEPFLNKNADARALAACTLVVALIEKLLETKRISQADLQDVQKRAVAALPQNKFAAIDARDIIVELMARYD